MNRNLPILIQKGGSAQESVSWQSRKQTITLCATPFYYRL